MVNKRIVEIIFKNACSGFSYDSNCKRYQLNIRHISEEHFRYMANEAKSLGLRLNMDTVNDLLIGTRHDSFILKPLNYCLPVSLMVNGEAVLINFAKDSSSKFLELMKMTDTEFLIVNSNIEEINEKLSIPYDKSLLLAKGRDMYLPSIGLIRLQNVSEIKPRLYYRYVDEYFMKDNWRYEVSFSLWPLYNILNDFILADTPQSKFQEVMDVFASNGLSSFVFRMMLNAIQNKKNYV